MTRIEKQNKAADKGLAVFVLIILLGLMGGCHTLQTGPACDLTPYNDSMATQMGFMLIDQLPRILR